MEENLKHCLKCGKQKGLQGVSWSSWELLIKRIARRGESAVEQRSRGSGQC